MFEEKGIYISVTSWENDADNYKTEVVGPVPKEDVSKTLSVVKLFRSRNSRHDGENLGNSEIPYYDESDEHPIKSKINEIELIEQSLTEPFDIIDDLIGSWADGEYYRVYESHEVFEVKEPVINITKEFEDDA